MPLLNEIKRKLMEHDSLYTGINFKDIEDKEARYSYVKFRCTDDEKEMIKALARLKNQTVSEFIRQLVLVQYLNEFLH